MKNVDSREISCGHCGKSFTERDQFIEHALFDCELRRITISCESCANEETSEGCAKCHGRGIRLITAPAQDHDSRLDEVETWEVDVILRNKLGAGSEVVVRRTTRSAAYGVSDIQALHGTEAALTVLDALVDEAARLAKQSIRDKLTLKKAS